LQTPLPLCDFEQWIDTEISETNKKLLQGLKEWDVERRERYERRLKEEAAEKERKEEEERRKAAADREERERKLERGRRAKAALEENPDAQRKGKWPCCTQYSTCVASLWFIHEQCWFSGVRFRNVLSYDALLVSWTRACSALLSLVSRT
jgi:MoaA/NifB/PqqE/SkfB family radical SAM enzyme